MSDNSQYIVSARKYRPATFATVVGQKNLTATLKNSISSGRLAQAYLFCGPRGVGKTSCARIFARTINCEHPTADGEACGECDSCKAITRGNSFNLIELDAASNNSVDDIRNLIEQVNVPPQQGSYKVFIIDEVHMLSPAAFNAFLKTLEEPPKYAIFILATTEKHKVIPTILSRCQIYDFKRISVDDMVEHLKYVAADRGVEADPRALGIIARKADGAMRDALSIFDQVAASSNGNISYESALGSLNVLDYDYYFRLVNAFAAGSVPDALLIYKEIRDKGFDSLFFINGLASHVRDLMAAADPRTIPLLEIDAETAASFKEQTSKLPLQWYYAAMRILNDADFNYRTASNKQLLVEVALIRVCQLIKPATPPFDLAEDLPSLRNPSESTGAAIATSSDAPAVVEAKSPTASSEPTEAYLPKEEPAPEPIIQSTVVTPPSPATPRESKPEHKPVVKGRPHAFRLSEAPKEMEMHTLEKKNNPFSEKDFDKAWHEFMARNSDMHILLSTMRVARRKKTSDTSYALLVEHPAQLQAFESSMTKLVTFLREYLKNDFLTLEPRLDDSVAILKPLPPQEFLKKIISENRDLGEFLKSIDAEMA